VIVTRKMPTELIERGGVVSCARYSGAVRRAVLQWKDHGDLEVGALLASHLGDLVAKSSGDLMRWGNGPAQSSDTTSLAVVPAPSSAKSRAKRGRLQTRELADAVAKRLNECGTPACVVEGLAFEGMWRKSVQARGARAREQRARHAITVRPQKFPADCSRVFLVDDICTTGSTLLGCARRLTAAGFRVVGAASVASVQE
jgi:predicted amidophosphoribosyltransferase